MCDIAAIRLIIRNKRYRKYHWKFSLRPWFSQYKFTTPHQLTRTISMVPKTVGYEDSRLIKKTDLQTIAEMLFDRNNYTVRVNGEAPFNVGYDKWENAYVFTRDNFRGVARRVRCGSRVLTLEWGPQTLRIVPVHAWKKKFVVTVVEQEGRFMNHMKILEFERISLQENFDVRYASFAKMDLIACVAWLIIIVNR